MLVYNGLVLPVSLSKWEVYQTRTMRRFARLSQASGFSTLMAGLIWSSIQVTYMNRTKQSREKGRENPINWHCCLAVNNIPLSLPPRQMPLFCPYGCDPSNSSSCVPPMPLTMTCLLSARRVPLGIWRLAGVPSSS